MLVYGLFDDEGNLRYIGATTKTLKQRMSAHMNRVKYGSCLLVHSWIRTLGHEPKIEILEDGFIDADTLFASEIAWIASIRATGATLFNVDDGGQRGTLGQTHSNEAKKKMSDSHNGIQHSNETKLKIAESQRAYHARRKARKIQFSSVEC